MDRYSETLMTSISLQGCAVTTAKPAPFLPRDGPAHPGQKLEPATGQFISPSRQLAEAPQRWQQRNQGLAPFQTDRYLSCHSTTRKRSNGLRGRGLIQGHRVAGGTCLTPSREEAFSTSPSSPCSSVLAVTHLGAHRKGRSYNLNGMPSWPNRPSQKVSEAIHQEPGEL